MLTLFTAGLIISGLEWMSNRYAHKTLAQSTRTKGEIHWVGLIFAVGCVILSRSLQFTPGYIYGILGAIYLLPRITDKTKSGKRAAIVQSSIFISGLCLWGLSAILPVTLAWLEPIFLTIFLIALHGVFFELFPISVFDGGDLWNWKKEIWFFFFTIVFFCFYHFSLNPDGPDIQALQQNGVQILLLAMVIFGFVTLVLWFLLPYRFRHK